MNMSKPLKTFAILLAMIVIIFVYDTFTGDRCVDLGGRWDWSTQTCEKGPNWEGGNQLLSP